MAYLLGKLQPTRPSIGIFNSIQKVFENRRKEGFMPRQIIKNLFKHVDFRFDQ